MLNLSPLDNQQRGQQIAALDLGSNSFHLIVARWQEGQIHIIDRIKEPVRLGWGLSETGTLDQASIERAMACFARFGERLRTLSVGNVRIAGTKTLRSVKKADQFLFKAQELLGHPVEIISGEEEARIIYLGVACDLAPGDGHRLVVDIGGGSTEVIIGHGMNAELKESLSMGCVAITKHFFTKGKVTAGRIKKARTACMQELVPVLDELSEKGWDEEIGASGTIRAAAQVCIAQGFSDDGTIKLKYLEKLLEQYTQAGEVDYALPGLSENRQPVFLGGLIILATLFEGLQLKAMTAAQWALREGLLYDLKGRLEHSDLRDSSVLNLANRFHVNLEYAQRVEQTGRLLLSQAQDWVSDYHSVAQLLHWGSLLFMVGLDITHSDYHKHGSYIVEHVDLPGFSRPEQLELALLVRGHRKSIRKNFPMERPLLLPVLLLLRMAIILQRGRRGQAIPPLTLSCKDNQLTLNFSAQWLEHNPLTLADLQNEQRFQEQAGYTLNIAPLTDA
ncbi:Ppx/GppA phosphatase family protein [Celerinatantimonas yamalensis]|uniref:Ppx/GppA phosphatase family protein n=1 Tax=Celerinatantimonas yamalensis TaxID=559956 RepID=A0ABW9GB72_9GAMM